MWYSRRKIKAAEVNIKKGKVKWKITANNRPFICTKKDNTTEYAKLFNLSLRGDAKDLCFDKHSNFAEWKTTLFLTCQIWIQLKKMWIKFDYTALKDELSA